MTEWRKSSPQGRLRPEERKWGRQREPPPPTMLPWHGE
jgi:hypothetical protein